MKKIVLIFTLFALSLVNNLSYAQLKETVTVHLKVFDSDKQPLDVYSAEFRGRTDSVITTKLKSLKLQPGAYSVIVGTADHAGNFDIVISAGKDTTLLFYLNLNVLDFKNYVVRSVMVNEKSGFVNSNLSAKQMAPVNLGQDFTYLVGNTPSAVTTSDAGAGVGYTGIRIRGSDATRINVTVNGVPINDAESHGVYWVNMPDLASSTSYVQIQRGVGTSTIGSGAFGANINIVNSDLSAVPFAQFQQSYGSFNTSKSTIIFGTGKQKNFNFGGRLSKVLSDGYLDRASSDLSSYQLNLNYQLKKFTMNAVGFGGKEKTYQSWYGTPESRINNDVAGMNDYADRNYLSADERANLLNSGRTYNYYTYPNQTDNYWQYHYQLHMKYQVLDKLSVRAAFFATKGKGFYEEYKSNASFSKYGVSDFINGNDTIRSTNLVRQRWLDNLLLGQTLTLNYKIGKDNEVIVGTSNLGYDGNHFGKVTWAEIAVPFGLDQKYYTSKSNKRESNSFIKAIIKKDKFQFELEGQIRQVHYSSKGIDNDRTNIHFDTSYNFYNPKIGVVYSINKESNVYSSFSIGNREPVRTDFIDNPLNAIPKPEQLQDFELGYIYKKKKAMYQVNVYNMNYKNQLVVTGELNDVGNALRRNVAKSYRRGIELIVLHPIMDKLHVDANLTLSSNKIINFEDYYLDYGTYLYKKDMYSTTDIAFSPSVIGYIGVADKHLKNFEIGVNYKYVGKQYLDNTSNETRKLPSYGVLNSFINRQFSFKNGSQLVIKGMANNLLGIFYSNNGYTFKYSYFGTLTQENFYYPQSGKNFFLGLDFKFL